MQDLPRDWKYLLSCSNFATHNPEKRRESADPIILISQLCSKIFAMRSFTKSDYPIDGRRLYFLLKLSAWLKRILQYLENSLAFCKIRLDCIRWKFIKIVRTRGNIVHRTFPLSFSNQSRIYDGYFHKNLATIIHFPSWFT